MKAFSIERRVRFSHCDASGIVYFPHYFDFINSAIEDWFDEGLGVPFNRFHLQQRFGTPVVNTNCDFVRPCLLGERLTVELRVANLGRSSLELAIRGHVAGVDRFRARHKVAMISLDTMRPVAIPEEMRLKMKEFLAPQVAPPGR